MLLRTINPHRGVGTMGAVEAQATMLKILCPPLPKYHKLNIQQCGKDRHRFEIESHFNCLYNIPQKC